MRIIKFRRAYFNYKDHSFAGFDYWGPEYADGLPSGFSGPSSITGSKGEIDQQFTGLHDKEGSEIYEGDICLKHWSKEIYGDREPEVGVIKWVDFGGRYTHESNGLNGHKYYCELHENLTIEEYPRSMFEVIGNIFMNPDLIDDTFKEFRSSIAK